MQNSLYRAPRFTQVLKFPRFLSHSSHQLIISSTHHFYMPLHPAMSISNTSERQLRMNKKLSPMSWKQKRDLIIVPKSFNASHLKHHGSLLNGIFVLTVLFQPDKSLNRFLQCHEAETMNSLKTALLTWIYYRTVSFHEARCLPTDLNYCQ